MDHVAQSTSPTLGPDIDELRRAVQLLADQSAIRDLNALYVMAVDDHDIERVLACFAEDGAFKRSGVTSQGHDELRAFYIKMMDRYITTLHTPHSHVISVDSDGKATGLVTGHAELSLDGTLMMAAYRYDDTYARRNERWVFQARSLQFMYVTPFSEMASTFVGPQRIRWPGEPPAKADFPEDFPTWTSYR